MLDQIRETIRKNEAELFAAAAEIFDHPEIGREEYFASELLSKLLAEKGFSVERGIGGVETSFRATWERGEGGPAIGLMMEYDALAGLGHGCGHHLQGPTAIGAALALMDCCGEPFKLVLYGTPDEERRGGKITMVENGCFTDCDVIFGCHTAGNTSVSNANRALAPTRVIFRGTPSHASGSPEKGRSALDAMMLCFHGMEILREHVAEGCRIHYTVLEGTGPSNIVPATAKAHITLRAYDRRYLEDMYKRMENVVKGACLMTDTTAELEPLPVYWNYLTVPTLRELTLDCAEELGAPKISRAAVRAGGSTDIGNVSWVRPTLNVNMYYCDLTAHTEEYRDLGKSENARAAMISGSEIISLAALKIIQDPALLQKITEEHKKLLAEEI